MTDRVLATDVYLERPVVGQSASDGMRALILGTAKVERFAAGTKASELPEWVLTAKALGVNGDETDDPLLGDHVWADESEPAPPPPPGPPGITLTGGCFRLALDHGGRLDDLPIVEVRLSPSLVQRELPHARPRRVLDGLPNGGSTAARTA
jgi:hypothetical protein